MRKKKMVRNVGVMFTEEVYQQAGPSDQIRKKSHYPNIFGD